MIKSLHLEQLGRLLALMKKKAILYIIATILIAFTYSAHQILMAFINKQIVDAVTNNDVQTFVSAIVLSCAVLVIACVINPFSVYLFDYSVKHTMIEIRSKFFNHIQKLEKKYFDKHHSGDLISRMNNDIGVIENVYCMNIFQLVETLLLGISSIISIFIIDWRISILMIILGIASLIINILFAEPIRKVSDKIQNAKSKETESFSDIVSGLRVIKIFNINKFMMNKAYGRIENVRDLTMERVKINSKLNSFNYILSVFSLLGVIVIGAIIVNLGKMNLGTIIAAVGLQSGVSNMFLNTGEFLTQLQVSLAGTHRIFEVLNYEIEEEDKKSIESNILCKSNNEIIKYSNVNFKYEDKQVLKNINFSVSKGKSIALVGSSGSGKSTIIKLLMRLYDLNDGNIVLNGMEIKDYDLKELRDQIAYVSQDMYLFKTTIEENIRYGDNKASMEDVIEAAKKGNAHGFIMSLPDQYKTNVGDGDIKLSGGQKQKIAIARAILKNAPILILDEATSALDTDSENQIQIAINQLMKDKTTIIIAHKIETIKNCDDIYIIDKGEIVEVGNHNELLNNKGIYYKFYNKLI